MKRMICGAALLAFWAGAVPAQETAPKPRPANLGQVAAEPPAAPVGAAVASSPPPEPDATTSDLAQPEAPAAGRGSVTNLPLPRFVSLKGTEGNARRGPGLTHRIDWVFTRRDMPLEVTAEFENWRRIQDQDGVGGWVHYSLLSGTRTVLTLREVMLTESPDPAAPATAILEAGVVARIAECVPDWCRVTAAGARGWLPKTAVWGVQPGEVLD